MSSRVVEAVVETLVEAAEQAVSELAPGLVLPLEPITPLRLAVEDRLELLLGHQLLGVGLILYLAPLPQLAAVQELGLVHLRV